MLRSLRWRLWLLSLLVLGLTLASAGWVVVHLFERHVRAQFEARLQDHWIDVLASLHPDEAGSPQLDGKLADPRWSRQYGGLYFQVQRAGDVQPEPWLRSRSLWDERLSLPVDELADGTVHWHDLVGPGGQALRVMERTVQWSDTGGRWRVAVAADQRELVDAMDAFRESLALALGVVGAVLMAALGIQVNIGLKPLRALQAALQRVHQGQVTRLEGSFPTEVLPLVQDFNRTLAYDEQVVERARRLTGNLAHAIKTPLAAMVALAEEATWPGEDARRQWQEQVQAVRDQVDWHLRRARAAGAAGAARRTAVVPVLQGLLRVMDKVHARREGEPPVRWELRWPQPPVYFAGETQDLQEMAGNLMDNACKWARRAVRISVQGDGGRIVLAIEDDGPGIAPELREAVLARGIRADERVPGSGLGLDIVRETAALYGGELRLLESELGGLRAELWLPQG